MATGIFGRRGHNLKFDLVLGFFLNTGHNPFATRAFTRKRFFTFSEKFKSLQQTRKDDVTRERASFLRNQRFPRYPHFWFRQSKSGLTRNHFQISLKPRAPLVSLHFRG